jgi:hypothetical protein
MRADRLEEFAHQFGIERADLPKWQFQIADQIGSRGQIQRTAHLCVVHRKVAAAIAVDATLVTQRLRQGLTKGNTYILDGVVVVDVQITSGTNGHVDQ